MKLNWGFGIAIFVGIFMIFISTLVYKCSKQNVDLVSENYYNQEINYQKTINKINTSNRLSAKIDFKLVGEKIILKLPEYLKQSNVIGTVEFFKPDNKLLDFEVPLNFDADKSQSISMSKVAKGRWNLKVNYSDQNNEYYMEDKINLN